MGWPLAQDQRLSVNGVDLGAYAVIAESLAGLMSIPKKRGDNLHVPGRHGTLHTTRKLYDENTIVLPLLVAGVMPDGSMPIGSTAREQLYHRADELCRIFAADTITLEHTGADQSTRRLTGEVLDVVSFTRNLGITPVTGSVKVAIRAAYPFWTDLQTSVASMTVATGGQRLLAEFAASTAPIEQMTISFVGPISNPTLSVPATGVYVAYDRVIPGGQKLVIDTTNWLLSPGDGAAWTVDYGLLRHGGASGRWFEIAPATPAPVVVLTHTGGGVATATVQAANTFLIG